MNKESGKALSLLLAVVMLLQVFSIGTFAFSNDYVTVDCPENFDEDDWGSEDGFYVDVYYNEWNTAEDGTYVYTGNSVNLYMQACWEDTLETYYDELTLEYLEDFLEGSVDSIDSTTLYYTSFGEYDAVAYDLFYTYTGEDETINCLYSEVVVVTHGCCVTLDIDVMNAEDLTLYRNEIAEKFLGSITYNDEAIQQAEEDEKRIFTIIIAVVIGVFLIGVAIVVIIVVVVVKASKKKKEQQAQQYNPYGYNPNGQYNPYGQQYNPNMQQNNVYTQYTPPSYIKPPVSEQKDPLDLDNKD